MTDRFGILLTCLLIAGTGCSTTNLETRTPTGEIGSGMPTSTGAEPGKELYLSQRLGEGKAFRLGGTRDI